MEVHVETHSRRFHDEHLDTRVGKRRLNDAVYFGSEFDTANFWKTNLLYFSKKYPSYEENTCTDGAFGMGSSGGW